MLNSREKLAETPFMTVVKDIVTSPSDAKVEYTQIKTFDSVLIVPIKIGENKKDVSFVMVQQYRYPVGKLVLEFPGGSKNPDETTEQAAIRELKEETGYDVKSVKFMYVFEVAPSLTSAKTYVYMAIVDGEPADLNPDESEKDFQMVRKEYSADELLKLLRDNEITDSKTVAALATVLLQSPKALEYANSLSGDN